MPVILLRIDSIKYNCIFIYFLTLKFKIMKNSNLKKALASLNMNNDLEIINPETVKGGVNAAESESKFCLIRIGCGKRTPKALQA